MPAACARSRSAVPAGIGRATAIRLAARGHRALVAGQNTDSADLVVKSIRADGGRAEALAADLSDVGQVLDLARAALEAGEARVDVLVNDAAAFPPGGPTGGTTAAVIDAAFALNVRGPYLLVGALAPGMAERGHGAIVNLISTAASIAIPGLALYGATKAALAQLTSSWAAEFGSRGVRVNAVSPGPTSTEGNAQFKELLAHLVSQSPAARFGKPEEIAAAIEFLVSDDASFVNGFVVPVDGGRLAV